MTALIPAVAGALVVDGIIGVAVGLNPTPAKAPAPTKPLLGVTRLSSVSRRTRQGLGGCRPLRRDRAQQIGRASCRERV